MSGESTSPRGSLISESEAPTGMVEHDSGEIDDPHIPTPIVTEQDDGSFLVERDSSLRTERMAVVAPEDRPLFDLVLSICHEAEAHVPDLMPAHIATECEDLVDARDTVMNYTRGMKQIGPRGNGSSYGMGYLHALRDAIEAHRNRDPVCLVAVGCSGSKHEDAGLLPAKDRYKGGYWTNKREYGETVGDEWRVISAQHAVLHPAEEIEYYERTPDHLRGVPVDHDGRLPNGDDVRTLLDRWALDIYHGLREWIDAAAGGIDPLNVRLQVLLGRSYHDPLDERGVFDALRARGELVIEHPFREVDGLTGIGKQREWMCNEVGRAAALADGGEKQGNR